jgi:hypothetical protein
MNQLRTLRKLVQRFFAISLTLALVLPLSCGTKELSVDEAAQKIKEKLFATDLKNVPLEFHFLGPGRYAIPLSSEMDPQERAQFDKLSEMGLMNIVDLGWKQYVELTEKGLPYLILRPGNTPCVMVGEADKIELKEVRKWSDNERVVSFTVKYKQTSPFGEVLCGAIDCRLERSGTTKFNHTNKGWQPAGLDVR